MSEIKFSKNKSYTIGKRSKGSYASSPEFASSPKRINVIGVDLVDMGIKSPSEYVKMNPHGLPVFENISFYERLNDEEDTLKFLCELSILQPKQEKALLADATPDGVMIAKQLEQPAPVTNNREIHHYDKDSINRVQDWIDRCDRLDAINNDLQHELLRKTETISELNRQITELKMEAELEARTKSKIEDEGLSDGVGSGFIKILENPTVQNLASAGLEAIASIFQSKMNPQAAAQVVPVAPTHPTQAQVPGNNQSPVSYDDDEIGG